MTHYFSTALVIVATVFSSVCCKKDIEPDINPDTPTPPEQTLPEDPEEPAVMRCWPELPHIDKDTETLKTYSHAQLPSDRNKRNYTFCFDTGHHASLWVAYPLHPCYLGSASRTDAFGYDYDFGDYIDDPRCTTQATVSGAYYSDYGNTKSQQYSRGHQLPSGDRTASTEDNRTTFYATNMTPQLQALNGGAWEKLESLARGTWICSDTLYIVTGAIFDDDHQYAYDDKSNGKRVSVPTRYYKALLRTKSGSSGRKVWECSAGELQCIGFIFDHDGTRSKQQVYPSDACSVSQLESITGLSFFDNVPSAPKSTFDTSLWPGLTAN